MSTSSIVKPTITPFLSSSSGDCHDRVSERENASSEKCRGGALGAATSEYIKYDNL